MASSLDDEPRFRPAIEARLPSDPIDELELEYSGASMISDS